MQDLNAFMNSGIMWVVSAVAVVNILVMCAAFMRKALKSADEMGIPRSECYLGIRSAAITAIGPSMAPVITLLALMAVLGGPFGWMRMNDIGAARTELAMAAISAEMAGSSMEAGKLTLLGFVFVLWGAALNNAGWIVIGGYGAPSMDKAVNYLRENFNAVWVKLIMAAATFGLFGTLLANAIVKKTIAFNNLYAALISFGCMVAMNVIFKGNKTVAEWSLGIAMLVGMFVSAALF